MVNDSTQSIRCAATRFIVAKKEITNLMSHVNCRRQDQKVEE